MSILERDDLETAGGPPEPLGDDVASMFLLDPAIDFLNHGCFGARPRVVSEAQSRRRVAFETQPILTLDHRRGDPLGEAKAAVGVFLGMRPDDFGFVTNATGGVNAVLRSLRFEAGDELLTTTHVYNAVRQTMRFLAEQRGATFREVDVPLPVSGADAIFDAVVDAIGPRTRLVIVDHIASPTAVRFPVERIVAACADRGVDVLVDGAHAPGMLDLDVSAIGAAYYTGNLHKWVCAPPGAAFLWVRPDRQAGIHPNTISHDFEQGLAAEFAWQGTRDITAWQCVPDAIEFFTQWGWDRVRRHNGGLARWAGDMLARAWDASPATPADGSLLGSMAVVALPEPLRRLETPEIFQARLYDEFRIEVPVIPWGDLCWIRVSAQVYNRPEQYERLAAAVKSLA